MPKSGVKVTMVMPPVALVRANPSDEVSSGGSSFKPILPDLRLSAGGQWYSQRDANIHTRSSEQRLPDA